MARWDIEPAGVQGVLRRTAHAAHGFATAGKSFASGTEQGAANAGSAIVSMALAGFAKHHRNTLQQLVNRTGTSLEGAVNATKAYIAGDEEMAARAQHHAAIANGLRTTEIHKQLRPN